MLRACHRRSWCRVSVLCSKRLTRVTQHFLLTSFSCIYETLQCLCQ